MGPLLRAATRPLPRHFQALLDNNYLVPRSSGVPDVVISCLFIAGALAAVYFNTIIHPYTLADNRHYVFYIFRILRRHPAVKYLAILVYYICAWSVTNSLGMPPNDEQALKQKRKDTRPTSAGIGRPPCQSSFLTIWLVTTALSVVTAPLVEPRYFIIPWIMWRLHVQAAPASLSKEQQSNARRYDIRLGMETLWLLAIDAAIMYVFLFRGFAWPSEPGKVQRFLW
jgi:alpha-1,2-glucosyltransferase